MGLRREFTIRLNVVGELLGLDLRLDLRLKNTSI